MLLSVDASGPVDGSAVGDRSKRIKRVARRKFLLCLTPRSSITGVLSLVLSVRLREHSRHFRTHFAVSVATIPDAHTRYNWRSYRTSEVRHGIIIYSAHTYTRDDKTAGGTHETDTRTPSLTRGPTNRSGTKSEYSCVLSVEGARSWPRRRRRSRRSRSRQVTARVMDARSEWPPPLYLFSLFLFLSSTPRSLS